MLEMADIFSQYGDLYIDKYGERMLPSHRRVIKDIIRCRTPELGGQVFKCPDDHEVAYSYHSCMNRHCPKCQNDQAEKWLRKQQKLLVNVPYFLITFPLPAELREIARSNQWVVYNIAFKASAETMKKLALDPKYIGGNIGFMGILHTWGRDLSYHPHVHYIVPGGGISEDKTTWIHTQYDFFLPVKALSKIFRAKFRDALKKTDLFDQVPRLTWKKNWVVHCKPAGKGDKVLKYFAPYVYRVAISNKRLVKLEKGKGPFKFKDLQTQKMADKDSTGL